MYLLSLSGHLQATKVFLEAASAQSHSRVVFDARAHRCMLKGSGAGMHLLVHLQYSSTRLTINVAALFLLHPT